MAKEKKYYLHKKIISVKAWVLITQKRGKDKHLTVTMATKPDAKSQNKMAVGDGVGEAVEQLINTASALGSTTIDLSKKRLTQVPPEVLDLQQLEVLFTVFY